MNMCTHPSSTRWCICSRSCIKQDARTHDCDVQSGSNAHWRHVPHLLNTWWMRVRLHQSSPPLLLSHLPRWRHDHANDSQCRARGHGNTSHDAHTWNTHTHIAVLAACVILHGAVMYSHIHTDNRHRSYTRMLHRHQHISHSCVILAAIRLVAGTYVLYR